MGAAIPIISAVIGLGSSLLQSQSQAGAQKSAEKAQKKSQQRQEDLLATQETTEEAERQRDISRRRQRARAATAGLRRSTILTSPLGLPATGAGGQAPRTLLGA